jgi:hypothetical protein
LGGAPFGGAPFGGVGGVPTKGAKAVNAKKAGKPKKPKKPKKGVKNTKGKKGAKSNKKNASKSGTEECETPPVEPVAVVEKPMLPLLDVDLSLLFRALCPRNVLRVLRAFMNDQKLLFLSNDISVLFPIIEGFLGLMYPFEGGEHLGVYMPIIPKLVAMQNDGIYFNMPFQFVMGMDKSVLRYVEDCVPDDVVRIDLGSNTVWQGSADNNEGSMGVEPLGDGGDDNSDRSSVYSGEGSMNSNGSHDDVLCTGLPHFPTTLGLKLYQCYHKYGGYIRGSGKYCENDDVWIEPPDAAWKLTNAEKLLHVQIYYSCLDERKDAMVKERIDLLINELYDGNQYEIKNALRALEKLKMAKLMRQGSRASAAAAAVLGRGSKDQSGGSDATMSPQTATINTQSFIAGGDDFQQYEKLIEDFHYDTTTNDLLCRTSTLTFMLSMFKSYGRYMLVPKGNLINSGVSNKRENLKQKRVKRNSLIAESLIENDDSDNSLRSNSTNGSRPGTPTKRSSLFSSLSKSFASFSGSPKNASLSSTNTSASGSSSPLSAMSSKRSITFDNQRNRRFDRVSFLIDTPITYRPMIEKFIGTKNSSGSQAWSLFIQEREAQEFSARDAFAVAALAYMKLFVEEMDFLNFMTNSERMWVLEYGKKRRLPGSGNRRGGRGGKGGSGGRGGKGGRGGRGDRGDRGEIGRAHV